MSILGWIILGGLAGWTASALTYSRDGLLMDLFIGIVGASIGGCVAASAPGAGLTPLNIWSLSVAVMATALLILAVPALRKRSERQVG